MGLCGAFFLIHYILTHIAQKFIEFHDGELFVQCENNNAVTTAFGIQSSISGGRKRTVGAGGIKLNCRTYRNYLITGWLARSVKDLVTVIPLDEGFPYNIGCLKIVIIDYIVNISGKIRNIVFGKRVRIIAKIRFVCNTGEYFH